jgi:hypothetical protein
LESVFSTYLSFDSSSIISSVKSSQSVKQTSRIIIGKKKQSSSMVRVSKFVVADRRFKNVKLSLTADGAYVMAGLTSIVPPCHTLSDDGTVVTLSAAEGYPEGKMERYSIGAPLTATDPLPTVVHQL